MERQSELAAHDSEMRAPNCAWLLSSENGVSAAFADDQFTKLERAYQLLAFPIEATPGRPDRWCPILACSPRYYVPTLPGKT